MSRILCLDIGEKNIGVAVSDRSGIFAKPHSVIAKNEQNDIAEIKKIMEKEDVKTVVMGIPYNLSGDMSEQGKKILEFKEKFEKETTTPVVLWDERYSTKSAQSSLIEGGMRREDRKKVIDKIAAAIILQSYLDSNKK